MSRTSLYINFVVNFWQTLPAHLVMRVRDEPESEFLLGELPSVGGASAWAADAGFARRTGAEGGENPLRLLFAAFGAF